VWPWIHDSQSRVGMEGKGIKWNYGNKFGKHHIA
jgi:hypothetical protein